jgi:23S rRNA (cytosine1962-C5)-methyltransferase
VFGESDGLPGLVIDRYDDVFSVQVTTAGMEAHQQDVLTILDELFSPKGVVLRNDSPMRALEGLESYIDVQGDVPAQVGVQEQESRFEVSLTQGQKTGWFFDQADNRSRMLRYVSGKRVLDLFSYVGGWGIRAAAAGATQVTCVDASSDAVEYIASNAAMNQVNDKVASVCGDVFEVMKQLKTDEQLFDVVIADPPAFVKRKKDFDKGSEAYQRLNHQAMHLLGDDGILITASCSYHMEAHPFQRAVAKAAHQARRQLQILGRGGQSVDHPVHPAMPETEYLKALFCRVY